MNNGFNFLDELSAEPNFSFFVELEKLGFERIDNPLKDDDTHYRGQLYDYFSNSDPIVDIYRIERPYSGAEPTELVITKDETCVYKGLIPLSSFSFKFLMSQLFPSKEYIKHLENASWNTIGNEPQPHDDDYKLEASQQLVNLLLDYGFKEDTKTRYPEHYNYLKCADCYNPYSVKRSFVKGKFRILFDYIRIEMSYNSATLFFGKSHISVNELTSIIYFNNVPTEQKTYLYKLINEDYFNLHNIYNKLNSEYFNEKFKGKSLEKYKKHQRSMFELKAEIITKLVRKNSLKEEYINNL